MSEPNKSLFIASDHAGYELKEQLKSELEKNKTDIFDITDFGCDSTESVNYPDFAHKVAEKVSEDPENNIGILVCGSGIGMSIAANRHKNVRAALCSNQELARLSREHNNANILCLGARFHESEEAIKIMNIWLNTDFLAGRHQLRVDLVERSKSVT